MIEDVLRDDRITLPSRLLVMVARSQQQLRFEHALRDWKVQGDEFKENIMKIYYRKLCAKYLTTTLGLLMVGTIGIARLIKSSPKKKLSVRQYIILKWFTAMSLFGGAVEWHLRVSPAISRLKYLYNIDQTTTDIITKL